MEEILIPAIIGIVVALISAANKKKKRKDDDGQGQPARPHVSDFQRALMLLEDFDRGAQPSVDAPPPAPAPLEEAAAPLEGSSSGEWTTAHEGGFQDILPGVAEHDDRPAPVRPQLKPLAPSAAPAVARKPHANIDPIRYFADEKEDEIPATACPPHTGGLRLCFGKNELVRAVIYSEILERRV